MFDEPPRSARARAEFSPSFGGVRVALSPGPDVIRQWTMAVHRHTTEHTESVPEDWLQLREDEARALYEALAEYFGHSGHDTRALRKDYDAERARVDKLTDHLMAEARRVTVRRG